MKGLGLVLQPLYLDIFFITNPGSWRSVCVDVCTVLRSNSAIWISCNVDRNIAYKECITIEGNNFQLSEAQWCLVGVQQTEAFVASLKTHLYAYLTFSVCFSFFFPTAFSCINKSAVVFVSMIKAELSHGKSKEGRTCYLADVLQLWLEVFYSFSGHVRDVHSMWRCMRGNFSTDLNFFKWAIIWWKNKNQLVVMNNSFQAFCSKWPYYGYLQPSNFYRWHLFALQYFFLNIILSGWNPGWAEQMAHEHRQTHVV